jgi:ubiquinone/menaquinone biosynthesis C-methylase UbiE
MHQPIPQSTARPTAAVVPIPGYLQDTYWWAYLHPRAVRLFERQWLVNLILWGNFARLRDAALSELGAVIDGQVLQIACVYGNLTEHLLRRLGPQAHLTVVDVAPIQISNLRAKLQARQANNTQQLTLSQQDATDLRLDAASQDAVLLFFLLHELPAEVRRKTLAEAVRVTRPGGRIVLVDYHGPARWSPFRYLMWPVLALLEPFALDLWRQPVTDWLPVGAALNRIEKQTFFAGLYQKVVISVDVAARGGLPDALDKPSGSSQAGTPMSAR